jgi:polysaccharide chain length determinant protein (PEP-CTERM system associated)
MLGHRELNTEDYVGILKRRYPLILGCTIVLLGAGVAATRVIPATYESQTLILIEQQQVPEDYVKPVVGQDLDAQLASMKEQILSRSRLEPIINRYNLIPNDRDMDDRVAKTRKAIQVAQIHSETAHGDMPGFFVSFDARDPHTAQLVCGEITSLFVSENLNARQQSAESTTDFLKQQLDDAKRTLDDQDAKLAAFQEKYIGRLPDEESSNTNAMQALSSQLTATTQSISQMQQSESLLETLIAQQTHEQQTPGSPEFADADPRQKELQSLIDEKKQLDALYTPDYPDVISVTRKIADLQAEIAQKHKEAGTKTTSPVVVPESRQLLQLRAQLHAVQQALIPERREQAHIQQQIRMYESRIEQSPQVEEEYKRITRDHDTALQFYNSLLNKMNESSMATALERRQQGEQFTVMDPPNLPEAPKFPKLSVFASGGLAAGVFLGLLITGLLEYLNTSIRSEVDIRAFTKLPTLAVITYINNLPHLPREPSGKRRWLSKKQKVAEGIGK